MRSKLFRCAQIAAIVDSKRCVLFQCSCFDDFCVRFGDHEGWLPLNCRFLLGNILRGRRSTNDFIECEPYFQWLDEKKLSGISIITQPPLDCIFNKLDIMRNNNGVHSSFCSKYGLIIRNHSCIIHIFFALQQLVLSGLNLDCNRQLNQW